MHVDVPDDAPCSNCQAPTEMFGNLALQCRRDPSSVRFELRHRLVQQILGHTLRQAGIVHMVESQSVRLSRNDGPESNGGSRLTRPAAILLYGWRGDQHCCVDLVGVSTARGGWRDAASAIAILEQAKWDKHKQMCASQRFDFVFFGFSAFRSLSPTAPELLRRICRRYRTLARIC